MYITIKQTCERLGISRWTVSQMIKRGELQAIKAKGGRSAGVKVREDSLERYISQQTIVPEMSR